MPANNELIWGTISFVVLLGLMWKFACPGIKKGMDGRTERIRNELEDADNAKARSRDRARGVPRAARRREERVRPHHRGGAADRPTP